MRSMHSTSNRTCSSKTSWTDRATVITGSGRKWGGQQANQPLRRFIHRAGPLVTVFTRRPEPPKRQRPKTCLVGLGRSPVSTAAVDRDRWYWRVCAGQGGDRGIVRDRKSVV